MIKLFLSQISCPKYDKKWHLATLTIGWVRVVCYSGKKFFDDNEDNLNLPGKKRKIFNEMNLAKLFHALTEYKFKCLRLYDG